LRSSKQPILDDRPAPWILYGILVALAIFLLHNAIDFSLFENGPLIIFMILAGAALGARSPHTIKHRMASKTAWSIATAALAGFFAAIIFFVIPMCDAEAHARDGDTALRQRNGTLAAEQFKAAFDICPISNSDYAQRAAQAWTTLAGGDAQVRAMLAQAIASNPLDPGHRLLRARYMLQRHPDDQAQIREDFSRALAIDPNNVAVRIEYARALEQFGDAVGAKEQYRRALELDDKLDAAEPKRLSPPQRDEIRKKL
jgi:tetratricopeptide (TPR) repeat protein